MKILSGQSRTAGRLGGVAAALLAAAAFAVATGPAAHAVPSNPDAEPCDPDPMWPEICEDPNWPPPQQYRATGRDSNPWVAWQEAADLARSNCADYDVLRVQNEQDGNVWEFTITYTCP
jgi:hypothetical protein